MYLSGMIDLQARVTDVEADNGSLILDCEVPVLIPEEKEETFNDKEPTLDEVNDFKLFLNQWEYSDFF